MLGHQPTAPSRQQTAPATELTTARSADMRGADRLSQRILQSQPHYQMDVAGHQAIARYVEAEAATGTLGHWRELGDYAYLPLFALHTCFSVALVLKQFARLE